VYTPLVLVPWVWALLIVLFILTGFNACGFTVVSGSVSTGEFHIESHDTLDGTDAAIFWATMLGGSAVAFAKRRTRRGGLRARGWTVHAPRVHFFDGRFSAFPLGSHMLIKYLRLTQVATGTHRGSSCASFSVWPRPQVIRRFYDVDLVELPLVLPTLALFPERQYDKAAAALGGDDIVTESDEFNRRWRIVGKNKRHALAVLHPLMMELLEDPAFDKMPITIDGGAVMTWQPGRSTMSDLDERLDLLRSVAQSIPRHVWDDFGMPRDPKWGPAGSLNDGVAPEVPSAVPPPGGNAPPSGIVVSGLPPALERFVKEIGVPIVTAVERDIPEPGAPKADFGRTFYPEPQPPSEPSGPPDGTNVRGPRSHT
jgi:hypothetical protein